MGADFVARSGLGDELNLVPCDQHTMVSLAHPEIHVLGDAGTLQTSKAGSVAHFSAEVFVANFLATFRGQPATHGFDGHANCFIESGNGKGMLLDFNYATEPFTGEFPLPVVGPFKLLQETRLNHLGKLAFRWVYWNLLLPGRPIPLPGAMSLAGKRVEDDVSAAATGMPTAVAPASPTPTRPAPVTKPARPRLETKPLVTTSAKPAAGAPARKAGAPVPAYESRTAVNSTADPAVILPDPIIPKF